MTVIGILADGRLIARTTFGSVVLSGASNASLQATVSDLRKVEYVLQWNVNTNPAVRVDFPRDTQITGNIVGTTLYAAGATTISGEVITIGF